MGSNGLNGIHPLTNGVHEVNGVNGSHSSTRRLTPGIFAPIPSFFLEGSEDLDLESFSSHVVRVAKAGISPLVAGSMGEATHLTHSERTTLIRATRAALDKEGMKDVPIIAGTGTGSTRESIELCKEASEAGADYAIVIASGYFAGVLADNTKALKTFFTDVAKSSPIPVLLYNCTSSPDDCCLILNSKSSF